REDDHGPVMSLSPGVWDLPAMLIETLLDLAGLDYDVPARRLILEPVLPPQWPHIGLSQPFRCGQVAYRLERVSGSVAQRLTVTADLEHPVTLQVDLTCPGLSGLGTWYASTSGPQPVFNPSTGRLSWSVELSAGESTREWSWGKS